MILADSSVVVEYLRGKNQDLVRLYKSLPIAVCGPVRSEVLTGVRTPGGRTRFLNVLDGAVQLPIPDSDWDFFGDLRADVEMKGFKIALPDLAIAGTAILNGLELWSRDKAHQLMASVVPALNLYQEP